MSATVLDDGEIDIAANGYVDIDPQNFPEEADFNSMRIILMGMADSNCSSRNHENFTYL